MGWVLQQDRALLLGQARGPGRLAALDVPGVDAFSVLTTLTPFRPSPEADRIIERQQVRSLRAAGRDGRAVLREIDVFLDGMNARLRADRSDQPSYRRADIFSFIGLAGELFGRGGGDEARRSMFLDGLRDRLGPSGEVVFDDVAQTNDPDRPNSLTRAFPYGTPGRSRAGNAVVDAGSLQRTTFGAARAADAAVARDPDASVPHASNFLLVSGRRSTNGHPLFVGGPQIGYFYPGLTLEADISWPGHDMRGIFSPAHPGVIFIGRGEDFAYSLTSAGNDTADEFVETLCGGSDTRYRYRGRCREMGRIDAGRLRDERVAYRTTVHGPVTGYATVGGRRVAIARRRASAGRDALWTLPFRDATLGRVRSAEDLFRAANRQPFTFNVGYADSRDIALFSAGRLPIRDPRVDPRLPTRGTGEFEWRGFEPRSRHPQQKNPPSGAIVNWNNRPAPGFAAADNDWEHGPLHRNRLLEAGIAARERHDLASVVGAMNRAATQDLRSFGLTPTLARLLRGGPAPSPRAERMLELLEGWTASGSSRLDREPDGVIDAGAAPAIWDELYPRLVDAVLGGVMGPQLAEFRTLVGADNGPRTGFTNGAINHVDKDLRALTGTRLRRPFRTRFCGAGDVVACRTAVWAAVEATGAALEGRQGTADPAAWRADANAERIAFAPGLLGTTIRYTNRPSGIQQLATFTGRRPRP
jgi:acyl-homoserine lactone acylase PvdQ